MSHTTRIGDRAKEDVDAIFAWLTPRSVQGAISWFLAFRRAIDRISDSPESFSEALEFRRLQRRLRQALFKTRRGRTYRIVFEISDTEVLLHEFAAQARLR